MRKVPAGLVIVILALAGCGSDSSDGPSADDAAALLERKSTLENVDCSDRQGRFEFEFTCDGRVEGTPVELVINVSEDEEAIASTSCRSAATPRGDPCNKFPTP